MKSKNGLENLEEFLWFEEPNKLARKKNQGLIKQAEKLKSREMKDEGWKTNDEIWKMKDEGWKTKEECWKMKD